MQLNYAQSLINITHGIYGSVPWDQVGVDTKLGIYYIWKYLHGQYALLEFISQLVLRDN